MRRLLVLIGVLGLFSGAASAGGGCNYGSHAASDVEKLPVVAMADQKNSALLAKLQQQRKDAKIGENRLEMPITYN